MTVKAYHLCNALIQDLLENSSTPHLDEENEFLNPWPDFENRNVFIQCYTHGCELQKRHKPTIAIDQAWQKHFKPINYPTMERYLYDHQIINYSAQTYHTCFVNNLRLNFISRQRRAIRSHLMEMGEENIQNPLIYALWCLINDTDYLGHTYSKDELKRFLDEKYSDLITEHRNKLPPSPAAENNPWKPTSLVDLIKYYHFLSERYPSDPKLKNCTLVPQNKMKMHHIELDFIGCNKLIEHSKNFYCKRLYKNPLQACYTMSLLSKFLS